MTSRKRVRWPPSAFVEFAGLREFVDRPLRTYSSGMIVRLGFAIATDTQPDILILVTIQAMCQRVAWLDHGRLLAIGPAPKVVAQYKEFVGS